MNPSNATHVEQAALALRHARSARDRSRRYQSRTGSRDSSPPTRWPAQHAGTHRRRRARRRLKVGLTSRAVQQQLGVEHPDFGVLFDDMEYLSGQEVPVSRLMQPKIEAEIAFVVGKDLAGRHVRAMASSSPALALAVPALEIVDSAIADWKITLVDTVADNASCGLFVLGDQPMAMGQSGWPAWAWN